MSTDEIRELIQLLNDTGIAELEVQRGDHRVRIRKSFGSESSVSAPSATSLGTGAAPSVAPAVATSAGKAETTEPAPAKAGPELTYVKSPIVGTFYESPSPDSPPFVQPGDHVAPGKVLCIIESMKLMNEIEAEVAGVVESRLVQNGQPVEYGEALFGIRAV